MTDRSTDHAACSALPRTGGRDWVGLGVLVLACLVYVSGPTNDDGEAVVAECHPRPIAGPGA